MADKKISALTSLTSVDVASDTLPIVDNDATETKKVAPQDLTPTVRVAEQSSTSTPASGYGLFYAKTDGKPYFKNDGGTETDLSATADPSADQNFQGNYIVNEQGKQNHVANTMSSPYYRFDGTDDYVQILADGSSTFNTQHFTIEAMVYIDTMATNGDAVIIWSYDNTAHSGSFYAQHLRVDQDGQIYFGYNSSGTVSQTTAPAGSYNSYFNKWTHIVASYTSGSQKIYLNGNEVASDTDSGTITYYAQEVWINRANYAIGKSAQFSRVRFFNKVCTATEVKELYSGMSVPYKYKGANQTSLVTGDNSTFASDTGFWTKNGGSGTVSIGSGVLSYSSVQAGFGIQKLGLLERSHAYRVTFTISNFSTGGIKAFGYGNRSNEVTGNGTHSIEFVTGNSADTSFWLEASGTTTLDVDNLSIVRIGSVAEYDGSGIASDKWFDKSGNDLHGTVSGASVENAPSGDDGLVYEEGTFSPLMTGITNTSWHTLAGFYKRVGNLVSFKLIIRTTTGDATNSSNVEITGLPYTSDSTSNSNGGAYITYSSDFDDDDSSSPKFNIEPNTTKIEVFKSNGARFIGTDMDSVTVLLRLNGQYHT